MIKATTHSHEQESTSLDLTAADAVWIGTAALHKRYPEAEGFAPNVIRDEVVKQHLTRAKIDTIYQHIVQHLVATLPANPNKRRMLSETRDGLRRLFVIGDQYHSSKNGTSHKPSAEALPTHLRNWLDWYEDWSRDRRGSEKVSSEIDPLLALTGTWTFGDADTYLHKQREGWE